MIAAVLALALAAQSGATLPKLVHFRSPSGNINCIGQAATPGSPAFVECLVKTATWPVTRPKPARCDLDWDPRTIGLANRRVSVGSCRGDIGPLCIDPADPCSTLRYGRSVEIGPIRCTSATTGVTCRYRTAPRVGFRIARERYLLYRS
ncbi:MAG: DUF6636 domain-containing protein [Verrucomicrobiota bacterium]